MIPICHYVYYILSTQIGLVSYPHFIQPGDKIGNCSAPHTLRSVDWLVDSCGSRGLSFLTQPVCAGLGLVSQARLFCSTAPIAFSISSTVTVSDSRTESNWGCRMEKQWVVTYMLPVEAFVTGIKIYDRQRNVLDRLINCAFTDSPFHIPRVPRIGCTAQSCFSCNQAECFHV